MTENVLDAVHAGETEEAAIRRHFKAGMEAALDWPNLTNEQARDIINQQSASYLRYLRTGRA